MTSLRPPTAWREWCSGCQPGVFRRKRPSFRRATRSSRRTSVTTRLALASPRAAVGSLATPFAAAAAPAGATAGTGSSGQIAGYGAQFGGTDLDSTSEMGLKKDALTQSSVTFALTIVGGTLLENNQISNWSVVFGTAWGESTVRNLGALNQFDVNAVPEPSSLLLLGGGLTAAAAAMRRRRTRAAKV